MRIYTSKKMEFRHPTTGESFPTRLENFSDAPDWIGKDPLFGWAKAEGSLLVFPDTPLKPIPEEPRGTAAEAPAEPKKTTVKKKAGPKKEADEA